MSLVVVLAGCGRPSERQTAANRLKVNCSPAEQEKRLQLLEKLIDEGVFNKHEPGASIPKLWTGPKWRSLDYADKETFVGVAVAYYVCKSQESLFILHVIDHKSGNKIGEVTSETKLTLSE